MSARTRARLSAASFGPEWRPVTGRMGALLRDAARPVNRHRPDALLRDARRDLAAAEARWETARDDLPTYVIGPKETTP